EYFMFDPELDYLKPALQGFDLIRSVYVPIKSEKDGSLLSRSLGLKLRADGRYIAVTDAATGHRILRVTEALDEAQERLESAEARERKVQERAKSVGAKSVKVEEENAKLRAEIERLKKSNPGK